MKAPKTIKSNILEYFNLLNKGQKKVVQEQIILIAKIIQQEENKLHDQKCEHIRNNELQAERCSNCSSISVITKVINKTRSVTDYFNPLFNIRNSHIESYTERVNHCTNCNNEWEKYNLRADLLREKRTYYEIFQERIKERKKFYCLFEITLYPYQNFYAQSMYGAFKKQCNIPLSEFIKIFKSVF